MKQDVVDVTKLKPEEGVYRLGRKLDFDAHTEKFTDGEANELLTHEYRAPIRDSG